MSMSIGALLLGVLGLILVIAVIAGVVIFGMHLSDRNKKNGGE